MKRSGILLAAACALLICAMAFKGLLVQLPDPPQIAPVHGFDTGRAVARLAYILGDERPHPVDTDANDAVRTRLIEQMRNVGLEPQVTDHIACGGSAKAPAISCARVRNVFATIGPSEGKHLLLASHYDSTPVGPGATDDGIGMFVMLETAAELRKRQLTRPVTFLFTDGEEAGLLGARAFLQHNPLVKQVDTLLNFEARGVTGPAIMFETNTPNGAAIALYKTAVDRPAGNSLTADFAKLIPNSTDVEVLKARQDWTILNFAVIGNETRYHTPGDNLAALDRRSFKHMGDQALALATTIAEGTAVSAEGEHSYADLLGRGLVMMPLWASLAALAFAAALFVFLAWSGRRGLGRATLAVSATIVGAAGLAWAGQNAVGLVRAGEYWRGYPEVTRLAVYLSALVAGLLALRLIAPGSEPNRLRIAFWLIFLIVGAGLCALAPGASIFFLLPPLVLGLGMLLEPRWRGSERVAALIAFILLFLSWTPLLHLSEALLDFDAGWIFAAVGAIILLPALIELKGLLASLPRLAVLGGAAAVFIGGWAAAALAPAYSLDRKQAFGIEYVWDENKGKAHWLVLNDGADLPPAFDEVGEFKQEFEVPYSGRKRWAAPAEGRAPTATLRKLSETPVGKGRRVRFVLASEGLNSVVLKAPADAGLVSMSMEGTERKFGKGSKTAPFYIRCQGRSCDGMIVDLLVGHRKPVELTVSGIRSGLPPEAAPLVEARPANATPQYSPDATIGITRVRI